MFSRNLAEKKEKGRVFEKDNQNKVFNKVLNTPLTVLVQFLKPYDFYSAKIVFIAQLKIGFPVLLQLGIPEIILECTLTFPWFWYITCFSYTWFSFFLIHVGG